MNDIVFIGWALLFFALSWGFIRFGEKFYVVGNLLSTEELVQ